MGEFCSLCRRLVKGTGLALIARRVPCCPLLIDGVLKRVQDRDPVRDHLQRGRKGVKVFFGPREESEIQSHEMCGCLGW